MLYWARSLGVAWCSVVITATTECRSVAVTNGAAKVPNINAALSEVNEAI